MAKCAICGENKKLKPCSNCKGSGNDPSGNGFCVYCNGERLLCSGCQR